MCVKLWFVSLFETSGGIVSSSVTRRWGKRWSCVTSSQTTTALLRCGRQARCPQVGPPTVRDLHWMHPVVEILLLSWKCGAFLTYWIVKLFPDSSSWIWKLLWQGLCSSGKWHCRVRRGSDEKVRTAQRIIIRDGVFSYWLLAAFVGFQIYFRVPPPVFPKSAAANQSDTLMSEVLCEQYT